MIDCPHDYDSLYESSVRFCRRHGATLKQEQECCVGLTTLRYCAKCRSFRFELPPVHTTKSES